MIWRQNFGKEIKRKRQCGQTVLCDSRKCDLRTGCKIFSDSRRTGDGQPHQSGQRQRLLYGESLSEIIKIVFEHKKYLKNYKIIVEKHNIGDIIFL